MKKLVTVILIMLCPLAAHAALTCKGSGYGLNSTYTFNKAGGKNISLHIKTTMGDEVVTNTKGTAIYTSTVTDVFLGKKSIGESYYYFIHDKDSYTELMALSNDLKSMARSRPMPGSTSGNFMSFKCSGSL